MLPCVNIVLEGKVGNYQRLLVLLLYLSLTVTKLRVVIRNTQIVSISICNIMTHGINLPILIIISPILCFYQLFHMIFLLFYWRIN